MQRHRGRADIFFTGLSAVRSTQPDHDEPFAASTRSGKLLRDIVDELDGPRVYYTNLVKCLPLWQDRIRYPLRSELELCFSHYTAELANLSPTKVVLFGRQVSNFIADKLNLQFRRPRGEFEFPVAQLGGVELLSAHHPSYVLVYKRRKLDLYKRRIAAFLEA